MKGTRRKMMVKEYLEERDHIEENEAWNVFMAGCPKLLDNENKELSYNLSLIVDLTLWDETYKAMTVWSLVHHLIDRREAEKIVKNADPNSNLFQNPLAIHSLLKFLEYWSKEELISSETTLTRVFIILAERLEKNKTLLNIEK